MAGGNTRNTDGTVKKEIHITARHPGKYKTYQLLMEACTFRNMNKKIKQIIKICNSCQKNKPLTYNDKGFLTQRIL